jgi:rod shape-determining protein MreC
MFKKKHVTAMAVIGLTALTLLVLPDALTQKLRAGISNLFLPLFGLASTAHHAGSDAAARILPRSVLEEENRRLTAQNAELLLRLQVANEVKHENERLRGMLGWQPSAPWKLKPARVVLRDPANWWRAIQIDRGARDGLAPNCPVLTPRGLVGRLGTVGYDHAQVILLGDPNCRVSALVAGESRDAGIIGSAPSLDSSLVEMTYLPRHVQIAAGTPVVTSGLGGLFPKGVLVGQVVDTRAEEYGLYQSARVRLAVNLAALEEVWVIVP